MADRVAIIGAGYAGLACAVELADTGLIVDVFEASRTLGGRARAITVEGQTLDNGAHILIGAYRETLRLLKKIGVGETGLRRLPLHFEYADGGRIHAPPLPAPFHLAWALLTAHGLSWKDKLAAIRFMQSMRSMDFRLAHDTTVLTLLDDRQQPEGARRYLWEPLCLGALNTPPALASGQVFLNVLKDSLAAGRTASDLLLPTTDLSRLFPEPAAAYLQQRGGRVLRSTRIAALVRENTRWKLDDSLPYDHVVLAVAPCHLPRLLAPHAIFGPLSQQIEALAWQPIVTVYLAYPPSVTLPVPMLGMTDGHAQWVFDRGQLCGQSGVFAVVLSAAGTHQAMSHDQLADIVHEEIATHLPGLRPPIRHWVIEEKRATFACTPKLSRPSCATPAGNLWLAGDYVAGDYPATLEGAVRSGGSAARHILAAR